MPRGDGLCKTATGDEDWRCRASKESAGEVQGVTGVATSLAGMWLVRAALEWLYSPCTDSLRPKLRRTSHLYSHPPSKPLSIIARGALQRARPSATASRNRNSLPVFLPRRMGKTVESF
jgi:hypothetical protein